MLLEVRSLSGPGLASHLSTSRDQLVGLVVVVLEVRKRFSISTDGELAANCVRVFRGSISHSHELVKNLTGLEDSIVDVQGDVPPPPVALSDLLVQLVAVLDGLGSSDSSLVAG